MPDPSIQLTYPPVRVLYTIDDNPQSYLTVLNDRQDVYVHPLQAGQGNRAHGNGDGGSSSVGSTYLKAVSGGICYAR